MASVISEIWSEILKYNIRASVISEISSEILKYNKRVSNVYDHIWDSEKQTQKTLKYQTV